MRLLVLLALAGCTQDFGSFEPRDAQSPDGTGDSGVADTGTMTGGDAGPCNNGTVFNGHCYFAVSPPASFSTQRTACQNAGGHLATIGNIAEQMAITNVGSGDRWIGLTRNTGSPAVDASYAWIDMTPRGFANWANGEPDGSGTAARMKADGTWADANESFPYVGLCERP